MSLAEISRKPSVDCVMWLSVITVTQIYNKNKQTGKTRNINVQFEKKSMRKFKLEAKLMLRDEKFKSIIQNGKTPTQVGFYLVKTECLSSLLLLKQRKLNNKGECQQIKAYGNVVQEGARPPQSRVAELGSHSSGFRGKKEDPGASKGVVESSSSVTERC